MYFKAIKLRAIVTSLDKDYLPWQAGYELSIHPYTVVVRFSFSCECVCKREIGGEREVREMERERERERENKDRSTTLYGRLLSYRDVIHVRRLLVYSYLYAMLSLFNKSGYTTSIKTSLYHEHHSMIGYWPCMVKYWLDRRFWLEVADHVSLYMWICEASIVTLQTRVSSSFIPFIRLLNSYLLKIKAYTLRVSGGSFNQELAIV